MGFELFHGGMVPGPKLLRIGRLGEARDHSSDGYASGEGTYSRRHKRTWLTVSAAWLRGVGDNKNHLGMIVSVLRYDMMMIMVTGVRLTLRDPRLGSYRLAMLLIGLITLILTCPNHSRRKWKCVRQRYESVYLPEMVGGRLEISCLQGRESCERDFEFYFCAR